jgi:hypothetical protein
VRMVDCEIDVARIVNFDSFRAYRWLVAIAEPNPKLYAFLRKKGVDLNHAFNLLGVLLPSVATASQDRMV